ncbi:DHH family phosphoesterase [Brevibacillus nitrificans]|uniref:single-stranded-DNA-specific exonuclease RecJ n=1 Tax=Brevibacillus nitrificans TaxID=651560 RepID=UPI002854FB14|nr:DHH family phosphoesterase [Brevibacillus nitrificans]MDR7319679.1 single-stranded-DNA-specific exonuclease [Brevibacillus nitrificans]
MKWIAATPSLDQHPDRVAICYLARRFNLEPVLILKLYQQGIVTEKTIADFLYPSITHLYDPFLLPDIKKAVYRIIRAIQNKEKILIFGDYDADGMTATALLYEGLHFFGASVTTQLPLRSEGYGLSASCVENLPSDISLVITVDNGSSAHPAMQVAKQRGIDVIVTDHHEVLGEHPTCHAFVNPKRKDNTYPNTDLCGAGVAFKVVQALHELAKLDWHKHMWNYIEFATIATIADLMPLTGENRVITWLGLQKMNRSPSPVLNKLFSLLRLSKIDSTTIGFQIAPLFNACGRIDDPNLACEILKSKSALEIELRQLLEINQKRKRLTKEQFSRIEKRMIDEQLHQKRVIIIQDDFHAGLIGILASRIAERFRKPAIVMTNNGVASARSVQGSSEYVINFV